VPHSTDTKGEARVPREGPAVEMEHAPLSDVRIVELPTGIAGAYATKLLADLGARVTMVEPPDGHPLRRWSASGRRAEGGDGPLFGFLAAGKRSVTAGHDDAAAVFDLVAGADAVVCGPRPVTGLPAALTPTGLRATSPAALVVAVSPFGLTGPWADRPATELTVQALAGGVAHRGAPGTEPLSVGGQHGEWVAGTFAAVGLMVGLHRRARRGTGELADVSMLEALVMVPHFNAITHHAISGSPYYVGRRPRYPGDIEPTADGWVGFALVNTLQPWLDFCAMIGHPEWADDEELHNPRLRAERYDELIGEIRAWTSCRTTAEIVETASLLRIPVAPVGDGASVLEMDHFVERRFFQRSADGSFRQPSPPFRFDGREPEAEAPPAPVPGPPVATAGAAQGPPAGPTGPPVPLPLEGVRIADLTAFWAGPFATHVLAMLGAEVIHLESPVRRDGARSIIVRSADPACWWEWSHAFQGVNTNKLGVSLDVSGEDGRAVLRRVIASCDAVVENFSPRVVESWGLDEATLRTLAPDLCVLRMPAFGLTGPWRDRVGFAMTMEQVSGLAWLTGSADGPPTTLLGPCDPLAGAHGTVALLAALWSRRRTGRGSFVELPMVAGALNLAAEQVVEYSAHGVRLDRDGNRGPAAAPQNLYRCADPPLDGEDRWIALAVADDDQWSGLRAALGDPAWARAAELAGAEGRRAAHDEIDAHLATWCATRTTAEAVETLLAAGVPAAPVLTSGELLDLAPLRARGFLEEVVHPVTGRSVHTTYPIHFSGGPDRWHRRPAPLIGQDTEDVLRRIAGLTADEIDALARSGATASEVRQG
jgi:crotonobetainyl-CoA:carnitine CoA-transferase CaiB-like acyl-CoA transferase